MGIWAWGCPGKPEKLMGNVNKLINILTYDVNECTIAFFVSINTMCINIRING